MSVHSTTAIPYWLISRTNSFCGGRGREPVPLQNRVTPFGELIAVPERGMWMGNRGGCFHTDARQLSQRRWASKRWIVCVLELRGRHRTVMTPGCYTELFFLDEATALAAGHRALPGMPLPGPRAVQGGVAPRQPGAGSVRRGEHRRD